MQEISIEVSDQLTKYRDSFLWAAAKNGRLDEARQLLSMGANPNWNGSSDGKSSIITAIDLRNYDVLNVLLSDHANFPRSTIRDIEAYIRNLNDRTALEIIQKLCYPVNRTKPSTQAPPLQEIVVPKSCSQCSAMLVALEAERQERICLEKSLSAAKHHCAKILEDSMRIHNDVRISLLTRDNLIAEKEDLQKRVNILEGNSDLADMSLDKLEEVETKLRAMLDCVAVAKRRELAKLESQLDQRLCVCCQNGVRNVLLLPCRHLCLCASCSSRSDVTACPMCREKISEKLQVYS